MDLTQSFDLAPHACGVVADAGEVIVFDARGLAGDGGEPARLRLTWRETADLYRLIGAALRRKAKLLPKGVRVGGPFLLVAPGQMRR